MSSDRISPLNPWRHTSPRAAAPAKQLVFIPSPNDDGETDFAPDGDLISDEELSELANYGWRLAAGTTWFCTQLNRPYDGVIVTDQPRRERRHYLAVLE
jgi:hypothetical protein